MLPETVFIRAHRDEESHDLLCDAVIEDYGFVLIGGGHLYEIITWVPVGEDEWRWTLRQARTALFAPPSVCRC